jgi:hypothetical protein
LIAIARRKTNLRKEGILLMNRVQHATPAGTRR